MGKLRSIAGEARARVKVHLRRGNRLERALYFGLFSSAYRREKLVIARGHQEYTRRRSTARLPYLLRRNIHMLEKGLSMRPRRETFALAYIEETVELLSGMVANQDGVVSDGEIGWAREVLDRFIDATANSAAPEIGRVRDEYAKIVWQTPACPESGPHNPPVGDPPVAIDDLIALAERRKSIRWYTDQVVPQNVIDRAMQVAGQAPSACNRQPFTFRFFNDPEMVSKIVKVPMGTAGYGQNLRQIGVIVGDLSAFIDERDRHLIYIDGSLAAMGLLLGLESQGVSSVCINWPDIADKDRKMSELLGLAPHERVVMLVGFGYADHSGLTPYSEKRELADLRRFNR